MKASHWRNRFTLKIRISTFVLAIIPVLVILGWLGIWLPESIRTLMLSLFDQLGLLVWYPLAAIALALAFFIAALFKKEFRWQYLLESGIGIWILLNWPIY